MKVNKYIIINILFILVNKNHFEFLYIIGRGGFGKVWRVCLKKTNEYFALKEMSKLRIIDKRSEESIMSERNLLSNLNHPFIVNMHFAFQDFYNLYLIMDLLTGGDLRYHIANRRTFTEAETKFFISNMILALEYIHSKNIIHRDIKPENLVLESNGYLRITDFGVAKINEKDNSSETSGTPGYMAPEVILVLNHSFPSDFFALGVIGFEFMLGYRPYLGRSRKEIKQLIINRQAKIKNDEIPDDWSINAVDFINNLLIRKAEQRLGYNGIHELKDHPWMSDVDWEELKLKKVNPPFIPPNKENYDKHYCEGEEEIGEDTIERYQMYAQSELFPEVFKNYTFCNLSYLSNYHIKKLKRFKENIKIKDIIEKNVNKAIDEQKDNIDFGKKIIIQKEIHKIEYDGKNNLENSKDNGLNLNNNSYNKENKKKNLNINKKENILSKSVDELKQYNINYNNNKENNSIQNSIENKENKNELINSKINNKNKEYKTIDQDINNIIKNNLDNNSNANFNSIEVNKAASKNRKKILCKRNNLPKNKKSKEKKENKENIIYNNYINLNFNNFSNKNYNINNNLYGGSISSNKKITNIKALSNTTRKQNSKSNNNINKKKFEKSGSMNILSNKKNMFSHILSPNKGKISLKTLNKKNISKSKNLNAKSNKNNINGIISSKKIDYNNWNNLFNKKFHIFMDVLNKKNEKNTEKCHSSYGFNNKEDNSTCKRNKNSSKLSKSYRSLSMYNISNNTKYDMKYLNYNNSKNDIKLKNKTYNAISSSKSASKSHNKKKKIINSQIFFLNNVRAQKHDKIKSLKNSFDYKNKIQKFYSKK